MYLKKLHVHGFKSFAQRTGLEFSPGITTIVGPNGSGKSNIADSLRWVLGEQNMRQLRGKKSEDIIFAGGHGRAPLGMAEVTLTLDNSSNWLPSEFTEVTVSRRSYRSGDTEYLINGTKVRLKDVITLLQQARIGHDSYTIIGQGLVDQALSARAEERRGLFEDAAGIRHFQTQRNDAEQRLTLTQGNLSRLHDILNEIEPRLAPLAEQARRAQDFIVTRTEFDRALRHWYSVQWNTAIRHTDQMTAREQHTTRAVEALRATLTTQETEQLELRGRRNALQTAITDLRRQRGEGMGKVQGLERDLAVAQERSQSIDRTMADIASEQSNVQLAQDDSSQRIAAMNETLATLDETIDTDTAMLATSESAVHRSRQEQEREEARLRSIQRDAMQSQAKVAAAQNEAVRLKKQLADRQAALARRNETTAQAKSNAEIAQARLDKVRTLHDTQRNQLGDMLIDREAYQQSVAEVQARVEQERSLVADGQRERHTLIDRLALLQEWESSTQNTTAILEMLQALPDGQRPTVLGTVAQLIHALPGNEAMVEAALGSFLNAFVTTSEDDAWRCADAIRTAGLGRITVIWPTAAPIDGDLSPDHVLLCLDVDTDATTRTIIGTVLGPMTTFTSTDRSGLRWKFHDKAIVTDHGEVAHPNGWLVVGQAANTGESTLVRARELRDLPAHIDELDERLQADQDRLAVSRATLERTRATLQTLEREIKSHEHTLADSARSLAQAQRESEKIVNEAQINAAVEQQLLTEVVNLEDEIAAAIARQSEAALAQQDATLALEEIQAEVEEMTAKGRLQAEELARRRTQLAVQKQEQKATQQRIEVAQGQLQELAKQVAKRSERITDLEKQRSEIITVIAAYGEEIETQRESLRTLHVQLQAQEGEAATIDKRLNELEKDQVKERMELTQAENEYRKALLDAQRARDAIETLQAQMTEELADADLQELLHQQPTDDFEPLPTEEHSRIRRQIDTLRGRLKSLGGYDPEAPKAYEELKARYEFLTTQVRDMEEASARLRAVIIELDVTMRKRFEETFQAVNERFRQHFITLFQGGTARLELTAARRSPKEDDQDDSEDAPVEPTVGKKGMTGGVEVIVQIPGKKVQDLALLSGGERAMVSAALLFALLETNPPPFCLLDEVDAALDESNVVRFCEILQQLALQTQFIVITHNRVTMTHASAIYGVSMTESVSRILSMRLAEAQPA